MYSWYQSDDTIIIKLTAKTDRGLVSLVNRICFTHQKTIPHKVNGNINKPVRLTGDVLSSVFILLRRQTLTPDALHSIRTVERNSRDDNNTETFVEPTTTKPSLASVLNKYNGEKEREGWGRREIVWSITGVTLLSKFWRDGLKFVSMFGRDGLRRLSQ